MAPFDRSCNELCRAIAKLLDRIANKFSGQHHRAAYSGGLLISLDNNPGVRPIGIKELLQSVIGRFFVASVKQDLQVLGVNNQLCLGQELGADSVIHTMRSCLMKTVLTQYY